LLDSFKLVPGEQSQSKQPEKLPSHDVEVVPDPLPIFISQEQQNYLEEHNIIQKSLELLNIVKDHP